MAVLSGRIALITGASRGIGRAVAEAFAAEGAEVIATARSKDALDQLAAKIAKRGGQCQVHAMDMSDLSAIDRLAAAVRSAYGRLDILIGNAAIFPGFLAVHEIDAETMRETVNLNLIGNWYLLRAFHEMLHISDAGRVVFVTSRGTYTAHPGWVAYKASKAALDRVMANYALENADHRIRCNSLSPGPVDTDMGVFANEGRSPDMVLPEAVLPMFFRLVDRNLQDTGKMFDYRDFKGTVAIEPWKQFTAKFEAQSAGG